jgi:ABC-type uncharacterized transport system substrate-binding protein
LKSYQQGEKNMFFSKTKIAIIWLFLFLPISIASANAGKYKIGYFEGGSYWTYEATFKALQDELITMGWKDKIIFPEDAKFSPGWTKEGRTQWPVKAKELMDRKDLDIILAVGTPANKNILAFNNNRTPILGICVSDAVKSGFVVSENDSGVDNYTVRIVPGRYERMFGIFHDAIGFKKLGLIYPDTPEGENTANVSDARKVAADKGFSIIEYKTKSTDDLDECITGVNSLIKEGVDAFFAPSMGCFDWKICDTQKLFDTLMEHQIPTFARQGTRDVKAGALMGLSTYDFTARGKLLAQRLIKILEGAKPRSLTMVDMAPPMISMNLYVAERIGFDPPVDLLGASDELYMEITLPENRLVK